MNICYGAESGYGLMLFADEEQEFITKLAKRNGYAEEDALDALLDEGISSLSYDDYASWNVAFLVNNKSVIDKDACFIYSEKQGGVTKDTADLYSSLDEMADEFRKKYGDCLPPDFNYLAHLCYLRASYAG